MKYLRDIEREYELSEKDKENLTTISEISIQCETSN